MKRFISLLSALTIFVWIMPLGAFIKPSQEKTACGGHRAFHMCSMGQAPPSNPESSSKACFKNNGQTHRQAQSSASGENDFVIARDVESLMEDFRRHGSYPPFFAYRFFRDLMDPPPKAISL
jgi:hypothetical protein